MEMMIISKSNILESCESFKVGSRCRLLYTITLTLLTATTPAHAASSNNEPIHKPQSPSQDNSPKDQKSSSTPSISEVTPIAFKSSYAGLIVNQNYSFDANKGRLSSAKTSWGAEYRFFYKDEWTLALTGGFQGTPESPNGNSSTLTFAQETQKILRIYHPWYLAAGGRLSYHIPVKKISIPYERDQDRDVYTGGALSAAAIFIINERTMLMLNTHRWTSLSDQKENGLSTSITALLTLR